MQRITIMDEWGGGGGHEYFDVTFIYTGCINKYCTSHFD